MSRYLLVSMAAETPIFGRPRNYLFLMGNDEESRIRAALAESDRDSEFLVSGAGLEGVAEALAQSDVLVLTSGQEESSTELAKLACTAHVRGVRVIDLDTALLEIDPTVQASSEQLLAALAKGSIYQSPSIRLYASLKDALEPMIAAFLLLVLSPIAAVVALLIKLTSPGPVFYRQTRAGLNGKPFEMVKFRSMRIDAEAAGPVWASARKGDSRLTPIGGMLRATHLDEVAQLWNVVRGEMSFVGPRPERPVFNEKIEKDVPLFGLRTLVKPGFSGWAQIRQGYANTMDDSRRKLEFDLFYILKHSPALDLRIVLGTLKVLVSGGTEGRKRDRLAAHQARPVSRPVVGLTRAGRSALEREASVSGS